MIPINQSSIVDVGETNGPDPIITHNGAEVFECLYGDDIWRIESYPMKLNSLCSMLQKDNKHYYKVRIISKETNHGIHALCYVGHWFAAKGVLNELHKFWFCHDDLLCCVGGTSRKYAFNRPTLPSLWPMQLGKNLTQIEVVALEEVGSLLLEKPRCPLVNWVGNNNFALVNQPSTCTPWNFFGDGAFAHVYKPLDLDA